VINDSQFFENYEANEDIYFGSEVFTQKPSKDKGSEIKPVILDQKLQEHLTKSCFLNHRIKDIISLSYIAGNHS
jgi:hypothetical protein